MTYEQSREAFVTALMTNAYTNMCESSDMKNAISAIAKQIPKKPTYKHQIGVSATGKIYKGKCCECGHEQKQKGWATQTFCDNCGQALDWSDAE